MERRDNYAIQTRQAQERFLTYDHPALAQKLGIRMDETYLYPFLLGVPYRLHRRNGTQDRWVAGSWEAANTFSEVLILLDLVCDSSPSRCSSGRWKKLYDFGWKFHRSSREGQPDPVAEFFAGDTEGFAAACRSLGGRPIPQGDVSYAIPLFEDLNIGLQLWLGDEEFPSQLVVLWDENAMQYLRYETMHFATGYVQSLLKKRMNRG